MKLLIKILQLPENPDSSPGRPECSSWCPDKGDAKYPKGRSREDRNMRSNGIEGAMGQGMWEALNAKNTQEIGYPPSETC